MDTMTLGGFEGLTSLTGVSSRGIEVWVLMPEHIEQALSLLAEQGTQVAARDGRKSRARSIRARCEDCGRTSSFSGDLEDTIQTCPHCGSYMDVVTGDSPVDDAQYAAASEEEVEPEIAHPSKRHRRRGRKIHPFGLRSIQKPLIVLALVLILSMLSCSIIGGILRGH